MASLVRTQAARAGFAVALAAASCRGPSADMRRARAGPPPGGSASSRAGGAGSGAAPQRQTEQPIGPYEIPLFEAGARKVYYVAPRRPGAARLLANLHGVCNPPGYACGYWVQSASNAGFLVCPEGDSRCGASGPPTWKEPTAKIDEDLEAAIARVGERHPGEVSRDGAILTGFSLGAYAAATIAKRHPGRWPYLVLVEANVPLDAASLRAAGVRAVAFVAGERGTQIAGEKRTAAALAKAGFPARFWVMKDAGHHYSSDIDAIMADAIAFLLSPRDDDAGR